MVDLETKKRTLFSGYHLEDHQDIADQDREDGEMVEKVEQRKRLAALGTIHWKAGGRGNFTKWSLGGINQL